MKTAAYLATRPLLPILSIRPVLPPMMMVEGTARQRGWHFLRPLAADTFPSLPA
jgi:hypothetical protein